MNEREQRPIHQRDRVFNAETCRALRRVSRTSEAVFLVTLVLGAVAIWAFEALFSPSRLLLVWLLGAYWVAVIVTGLRAAIPSREVRHELKCEAVWVVAQTVGLEQRLPPESEYRPSTDTDDHDPEPPARPALALGRSARDWFLSVTPPLMALYVGMNEQGLSAGAILLLGVLAAVGPAMFWTTRESNTYPPEDPPHGRQRGVQ